VNHNASLQELLGQVDWVAKLARSLVADPVAGDDVAQDTWLALLCRPPHALGDVRAFVATLLRRRARREVRTDARRAARERAVARPDGEPSAAEVVSRVALQRELAACVLALDEPFRVAIVLRYFEGLDVDAIAARLGTPRNTVRARLQRGLQMLRERLDARGDGRERWWPVMVALSGRGGRVAPAAGATAPLWLAKVLLGLVGAAALVAVAWLTWSAATAPKVGGSPVGLAAGDAPSSAPVSAGAELMRGPLGDEPARQVPTRDLVGAAALAPRRIVDRAGLPQAGVRVRADSPFAVRWQGGDPGWIAGADGSLRLSAADEQRLRTDAQFAATFFARFAHPQEWRATILGEPLEGRETTTGADGSFAFGELAIGDDDVNICDPRFVLIAVGARGGAPWVVAPAVTVRGTVRGAGDPATPTDVRPLSRIAAIPLLIDASGAQPLPAQPRAGSDADGSFLVRRAMANGWLRIEARGFVAAHLQLTAQPEQSFDVLLERLPADASWRLTGVVVAPSGLPIGGAAVWFGRDNTESAADGRFAFTLPDVRPAQSLTVVAKGRALWQRDRLGAELLADAVRTRDVIVVLGDAPLSLAGIALGSDGGPRAGLRIGLLDPTLLDISFEGVEARVGGFRGGVVSGADGAFRIDGLTDRTYRLRAIDPATGESVTTAPLRAGRADLVLRLPGGVRRGVPGRVVAPGADLAQATVEVAYCTHVTKGGGTMFDGAGEVVCDASGRFELPALPAADAWLQVRMAGKLRAAVPVEECAGAGELCIDCDGRRWLVLVAGEQAAPRRVAFADATGAISVAIAPNGAPAQLDLQGACPPLLLPPTAVEVVLDAGTPQELRLPLTDDRAVVLRLR
jgi:RNA polymerase sigma-70 factor (ECF subfamily)